MISIVIPLYNKGELVATALESIARQWPQAGSVAVGGYCGMDEGSGAAGGTGSAAVKMEDCEIVVVDDGSTDDSVEVTRRYAMYHKLPVMRVIRQSNAGVGAARNRGVAEAKGDYVTFLDADDEWKPGHLSELATLAREYPQCGVMATNYENRHADGRIEPNQLRLIPFAGDKGVIDNYFEVASESNPPLWTSAVMVRREALVAVGGFPEGIKSGEDLLTWARLAARYSIAYSMRVSAVYNRGHSNPRPPERVDEVGKQLRLLYKENKGAAGLRRYLALWYNMRMSRCLAHRKYAGALTALWHSLRYRPTLRIAKPLVKFTIHGLRHR